MDIYTFDLFSENIHIIIGFLEFKKEKAKFDDQYSVLNSNFFSFFVKCS